MSLIDDVYALIQSNRREIGTLIPHIVSEESHRDDLFITLHPVERGATISDHAFKMPATVEMRVGYSNSTAGQEGFVQEVYQEFLDLQFEREPFDVFTGKRAYTNMLIASLQVTTDPRTEEVLSLTVGLREVIIVDTQMTSSKKQADPSRTGSPVEGGQRQLKPSSLSVADGGIR
ncbi:phage baseplate protein [Salinarimonas soli]|uniref:Dit-like phage tail protein N-terminal domain-containing protein n=1 Tax=Salinarimonas soli TaxID=1638099 RepID=A0A5B2VGB4_9HYPH|nr:hypothetical protein [Salinarimonas soli]KAA2237668.1 hypothetical protein F0L46_08280 [Salinarimonas soli]